MRRILASFFESVLSHLFALVLFSGLASAVAAVAAVGLVYFVAPALATTMLALVFFAVLFLCGLIFLLRLRRGRPQFDALDTDFRTLRKEISMKYLSRDSAIYTRKYQLEALKNDLDTFNDFYCWTGSDTPKVTAKNPRHKIFQSGTRGPYNQLTLTLGSTLKKGDTCEVEICWELKDTAKQAKPFISTLVNEPTDLLSLQVQMFPDGSNIDVVCEVCPTSSSRKNVTTLHKKFQSDIVGWTIESPRLFHHYEIRWDGPLWQ